MPGKKHSNPMHHKQYRGPWPEQHASIPGRDAKAAKETEGKRTETVHTPAPVHKIPPQTPK